MELKLLVKNTQTRYYDYGLFRIALYKHPSGPWAGRLSFKRGKNSVISFPMSEFRATERLFKKYIDESLAFKSKEVVRLLFTR